MRLGGKVIPPYFKFCKEAKEFRYGDILSAAGKLEGYNFSN